jgi:hypothetical protein
MIMKNSLLYYLSAALFILAACNNSNTKSVSTDSLSANMDSMVSSQCYMAVDGQDTAHLDLKSSTSGKITGDLVLNYAFSPDNKGTIEGEFAGDTLLVDYTFTTGSYKNKINRNPMAFLKSGERLVVGIGSIETHLGRSYFVKDKPINFERGRFKFDPVECP